MSLSLLLQQCPACLVRLIWMVLGIGVRWPYNCCFKGCCFPSLFNIACSFLGQCPFSFFSIPFVSIHVVNQSSRIDITAAWKKLGFSVSDRLGFHIFDNQSIAVHTFIRYILMS